MRNYYATIRHSSIASARMISVTGTLTQAKHAATKEFGGEQLDYRIVIVDGDDAQGRTIASRLVSGPKWSTSQ